MTPRIIGGNAYALSYDAENRLVSNGDGNRVKSTINGTTTFVGNYYEVSGSTVTKTTEFTWRQAGPELAVLQPLRLTQVQVGM
jgi:hypothetical protein